MLNILLYAFLGLAASVQIASVVLVIARLRRPVSHSGKIAVGREEGVTILRPLCGLENHIEVTLRAVLTLDHPRYEVIFCVSRPDDPVIPLARVAMAQNSVCDARLLIGDDRISANPKLNNVVKGWKVAKYDRIVMSDSNVLTPPTYLQELEEVCTPQAAFICSPPLGDRIDGFAAALEGAFLNTHQARWQLLADAMGMAFVQGKTIAMRRSEMETMGGLAALAAEPAEDAAATKAAQRAGRGVRLVVRPFAQPLGARRFGDVWRRQVRWARLRRASFPMLFLPEILTGFLPAALAALTLVLLGALPFWSLPLLAVIWYGAEYTLARAYDWPRGPAMTLACLLRDLLLPLIWLEGWIGDGFVWRGNVMNTEAEVVAEPASEAFQG